jgi:hypothetical protein
MVSPSRSRASLLAGVAALGALAALVLYAVREGSSGPPDSARAAASTARAGSFAEPFKKPLPESVRDLAGVVRLAREQAVEWRRDARIARMYAADVRSSGEIDRSASVVQVVFLSPELSGLGAAVAPSNALRFMLERGKTSTVEIPMHPAPSLEGPEPSPCDLAAIAGPGGPTTLMFDADYTTREDKAPLLQVFTRDRSFSAAADPFTCAVRARSTDPMREEPSGPPGPDPGRPDVNPRRNPPR